METFEATFLGTNGSCAYNNGKRKKYGSNTTCIAVKTGDELIVFDSGSGIYGLSDVTGGSKPPINLFFSHYHADHIEGLLFCRELFDPHEKIVIYGSKYKDLDIRGILENYLSPPFSPAGFKDFKAQIDFKTVKGEDAVELPNGARVSIFSVSHPGSALGYRVDYCGKSFCSCCDIELGLHKDGDGLLDFIKGADLLVLDSFFDDGMVTPGWGHSSWMESATWAKKAGAKQLALLHFSPRITDEDIDVIQEKARAVFPYAFTAADHMKISL